MTIYTHKHHIIPRHMGGTDDPSNLVVLTIEEHAEAHRVLWEKHGAQQDFLAWKMLCGQANDPETQIAKSKLGWQAANKDKPICKGRVWCHNPAEPTQQKMIEERSDIPEGWEFGRGKTNAPRHRPKGSEKQRAAARLTAKKMGDANSLPCTVRGIKFRSYTEAGEHFGVSRVTIRNWLLRA